jgi:hypothetical protein
MARDNGEARNAPRTAAQTTICPDQARAKATRGEDRRHGRHDLPGKRCAHSWPRDEHRAAGATNRPQGAAHHQGADRGRSNRRQCIVTGKPRTRQRSRAKAAASRPLGLAPPMYCDGDVWQWYVRNESGMGGCRSLIAPGNGGFLGFADERREEARPMSVKRHNRLGGSKRGWRASATGGHSTSPSRRA